MVPILLALLGEQSHRRQEFQPPEGMLTAGLRETERHRPPLTELRIVRTHGSPQSVTFWVHVDAEGRVLEVREFKTDAPYRFEFPMVAVIEAVRKITYLPFLRNGVPKEAWVQDELEVGTESERPQTPETGGSFPALRNPTDFRIKLSRSGCYGTCPSYSVEIRGDGKIEFHGARFISFPGDHRAQIEPQVAAQLLERFRAAEFFGLKDTYRALVTDNPTYCLELTVGSKRKLITDYVGAWVGMPLFVSELEEAVDETASTDRWVSAGPGTVAAMEEAGIAPNSDQAGKILVGAVKGGKWEAVRRLLVSGAPARISGADHASGSLLTTASFIRGRQTQLEVFKVLLENAELRVDKTGLQDALGREAGAGNVEAVRMLIAAGTDPAQLFHDDYRSEERPDQTYLMRAAASGIWEMLDDALNRPHDIHAIDSQGRSAVGHVVWSAPPAEDIFPLVDRLLAAGAGKQELTGALADVCDKPLWRAGLVTRGADAATCKGKRQ